MYREPLGAQAEKFLLAGSSILRSNVERTVSMLKGKFGDVLRSKTGTAMESELLCKMLCHNLCVLVQSFYELGVDPRLTGRTIHTQPLPTMTLAA